MVWEVVEELSRDSPERVGVKLVEGCVRFT